VTPEQFMGCFGAIAESAEGMAQLHQVEAAQTKLRDELGAALAGGRK